MPVAIGIPTFDGKTIFGAPCTLGGPKQPYRAQKEYLPGVSGCRLYRLGQDTKVWTVRGRLTKNTLPLLQNALAFSQAYINAQLYTFVDNAGLDYDNCHLVAFEPIGNYAIITNPGNRGWTLEIQAVIEQVSP